MIPTLVLGAAILAIKLSFLFRSVRAERELSNEKEWTQYGL